MFAEFTSIGIVFTTGMLLSMVTLAAGCAVGAWLFRTHISNSEQASALEKHEVEALSIEHAVVASQRIQDFASRVASHVNEHESEVESITANLESLTGQPADSATEAMFLALRQMASANMELQQRLAGIEKQIAVQADELRNHSGEAPTDAATELENRRRMDDEIQPPFDEWQRPDHSSLGSQHTPSRKPCSSPDAFDCPAPTATSAWTTKN